MTSAMPTAPPPGQADSSASGLRRAVDKIGVDNLSLMVALVVLIIIVVTLQPLFLSWQNLMNSLSQSIVIVGVMAIGQTVVIVGGMLDISVGSIASVASVTAASALVVGAITLPGGFQIPIPFAQGSMQISIVIGIGTGVLLGLVNGLVVTKLKVNPSVATLGTLAAFAGLAFLVAPGGKPQGVITEPEFTWIATARLFADLPIPDLGGRAWTGIPSCFSCSSLWPSSSMC